MGAAIGQTLLYSAAYKNRYPSQSLNIMPAVCTYLLGSGSYHIIELCKRIGVTVFNIDKDRQALRVFYLDDNDPRLFGRE